MVFLCGSERRLVLCEGGGLQRRAGSVSALGSWAPACVLTQCCKLQVGPWCQWPRTCLSCMGARKGMVLSPELVAVSSLGGRGAELGMLQPRLLGCWWWGPASIVRMWWLQHLPFPCLHPSPWPREHGRWQNCPFCELHFLRKQPIVLAGSPSLCLHSGPLLRGQAGPVARAGHSCPCLLLWGRQPPAPSNAPQHRGERSGLLAPRTTPVWG